MDKKSIIGISLIAVILVGWMYFNAPNKEQALKARHHRDSITKVAIKQDSLNAIIFAKEQVKQDSLKKAFAVLPDSIKKKQSESKYQLFTNSSIGINENVVLENELLKATISTKGGAITKVELKKYHPYNDRLKPLILFDKSDSTFQNISFKLKNSSTILNTDSFYFKPSIKQCAVSNNQTQSITLRLETNNPSSYIEYIYTIKGNDYMINYETRFVGLEKILDVKDKFVTLNWAQEIKTQEKYIVKEREVATIYYNEKGEGVDFINARKMEEVSLTEFPLTWVSFKQQFFNTTLIAKTEFEKNKAVIKTSEDLSSNNIVKTMYAQLQIPFQNRNIEAFEMKWYFGPTHYNTLKAYDIGIEKIIPTGFSVFSYINKWMVIPLLNNLSNINAGIVILILTLILKTVLLPIAYKTYISSAKMRVLKPEIEELNAKFPNSEDAMKKQQESMALYKRAGANPLSGCIPMLLQFPILIALFAFIPASIELRQQPFLWADDLSTYDTVYNFGFNIWGFGDHISLFAMLMFASTIIYTWMSQSILQPAQTNQMPGMKYMMYLMPLIFLAVMNSYAAGLSWYYFLANIITFIQTWVMKKIVDDGKLRTELLANMKKPEKKSAFQAKLEEMAKQKQALAKGKK